MAFRIIRRILVFTSTMMSMTQDSSKSTTRSLRQQAKRQIGVRGHGRLNTINRRRRLKRRRQPTTRRAPVSGRSSLLRVPLDHPTTPRRSSSRALVPKVGQIAHLMAVALLPLLVRPPGTVFQILSAIRTPPKLL